MPRTKSDKHVFEQHINPVAEAHLQPWDLEVFRYLNECRIATTDQISRITGRSLQTTQKRLRRLAAGKPSERWIERKQAVATGNAPWNYVLARGAELLGEHGRRQREPQRTGKAPHVAHTVLNNEFVLRVKLACDSSNGRVRFIPKSEILAGNDRLGLPIGKQLTVRAKIETAFGLESIPTTPDDLFQLHFTDTGAKPVFFLETDMGTEPVRRTDSARRRHTGNPQTDVHRKYQVYEAYWRHGRVRGQKPTCYHDFGFENFLVLFLTNVGEQRVTDVVKDVREIYVNSSGQTPGFQGWMFATTETMLASTDILSAPWLRGDGSSRGLTPPARAETVPSPVGQQELLPVN